MYKVFINDSSISLGANASSDALQGKSGKELFQLFLQLEKEAEPRHVKVFHPEPEELWKSFISYFDIKEAAGGVVKSCQGKILMIFRWGKWDLPKGKIEAGESIREGALREVEEECGISGMSVTQQLPDTYHTYRIDEVAVLKRTYWFQMTMQNEPPLHPQLEEDITDARWCTQVEVRENLKNTYGNIELLLQAYI